MLHDAQQADSKVSEVALQRLFLTYSTSSKLTASKLTNILSDFERAKQYPGWQPQLNPNFSDATQHPLARAARSLHQLARKLTVEEQALKNIASLQAEEYAHAQQKFESQLNLGDRSDVVSLFEGGVGANDRPAVLAELDNGIHAAKAIQHILRRGKTFQSDDLSYFMAALQREARSANPNLPKDNPGELNKFQFGCKMANWPTQPVGEVFAEALDLYRDHMSAIGGDTGLYAIPLVLEGTDSLENHVILVAIDADRKQINLLDSKGYSLERLEGSYRNATGMKQELESLGSAIFGQEWEPRKNILQMNIPKQQGANDCGAFVCDFTIQLLNSKSVGDIERTFDAKQRSGLCLQVAQTIKDGFLDNLDEDLRFLHQASVEGANMNDLLQSYEPTFEALQNPG